MWGLNRNRQRKYDSHVNKQLTAATVSTVWTEVNKEISGWSPDQTHQYSWWSHPVICYNLLKKKLSFREEDFTAFNNTLVLSRVSFEQRVCWHWWPTMHFNMVMEKPLVAERTWWIKIGKASLSKLPNLSTRKLAATQLQEEMIFCHFFHQNVKKLPASCFLNVRICCCFCHFWA